MRQLTKTHISSSTRIKRKNMKPSRRNLMKLTQKKVTVLQCVKIYNVSLKRLRRTRKYCLNSMRMCGLQRWIRWLYIMAAI